MRQKGISIVGTVNCIRKEIPQKIKKMKEDLYATKVFKHDGCTLTVCQAKTTKNVLLLSTMHATVDTGDDRKPKPKIVKFYNSTKFGVDVLDQIARKYTVNAASRRWPVQLFLQHIRFGCNQCPHFVQVGYRVKNLMAKVSFEVIRRASFEVC